MKRNLKSLACEVCGRIVEVDVDAVACRCWRCTMFPAKAGAPSFETARKPARRLVRHCPDCGGPLLPRKQYCRDCLKKRRRDSERASRRKRKAG